MQGQKVSVIFNGMSRTGEAMAVIHNAKDKADDLLVQPNFPISSADQEFLNNFPTDAYLF